MRVTEIDAYLGLDFGTANTVVSNIGADGDRRQQNFLVDLGQTSSFHSIIFYWQGIQRGKGSLHHNSGPLGVSDYLKWGSDQLLVMSMKSYLAYQAFSGTSIQGARFTIEEIITDFLDDLLTRNYLGIDPDRTSVVVGRPTVFVGVKANEALALRRLQAALEPFGFADLDFALEPAAAGYQSAKSSKASGGVRVANFSSGTANFSILRFDGSTARRFQPIAHSGIGLAGDSFDNRIVNHAIAPVIGKGSTYNSLGKTLPVPWSSSVLMWHRLELLNTPANLRYWDGIRRHSHAPETIERLILIVGNNLGF